MTRLRRLQEREGGFTLIELMVAMFILVAFMAVFSAAFTEVERGVRKQNDEVDTQGAVRKAFTLFDGAAAAGTSGTLTGPVGVRYATALNDPATVNGNQYIEWTSGDAKAAAQTCTQWRLTAAGVLQYRQWQYLSAPGTVAFTTVASGFATTGTPTFSTAVPSTGAVERELQVTLTAASGSPTSKAVNQSLFAAANTSSTTAPTPAVCQDLTPARP